MLVEVGQVLKVGDLPRTPQVSERGDVPVFQQVGQVRGQDVVVDVITELWRGASQIYEGTAQSGGTRVKGWTLLEPTLVLSKASSSVLPLVRKISTALSLSCHQRLCTSLISS